LACAGHVVVKQPNFNEEQRHRLKVAICRRSPINRLHGFQSPYFLPSMADRRQTRAPWSSLNACRPFGVMVLLPSEPPRAAAVSFALRGEEKKL
jgi:hypothetical protein